MNNWPEMMVKRVADVFASVEALLAAKVGEVRARYVDEARVVVSLVERLSA